jgi:hypothetical protein
MDNITATTLLLVSPGGVVEEAPVVLEDEPEKSAEAKVGLKEKQDKG